jgi:predicted NUDIX family NTP pyrophosphohydrolase
MPMKKSAGILLYRLSENKPEIFLVHPGGPFWAKKEKGAWSIPKGEYAEGEDPLQAARREFTEETGFEVNGDFIPLTPIKMKSGKLVSAWAVEGDADASKVKSNLFDLEWPPRSGQMQRFPEVDKGGWFDEEKAREFMIPAQLGFFGELLMRIGKR